MNFVPSYIWRILFPWILKYPLTQYIKEFILRSADLKSADRWPLDGLLILHIMLAFDMHLCAFIHELFWKDTVDD